MTDKEMKAFVDSYLEGSLSKIEFEILLKSWKIPKEVINLIFKLDEKAAKWDEYQNYKDEVK